MNQRKRNKAYHIKNANDLLTKAFDKYLNLGLKLNMKYYNQVVDHVNNLRSEEFIEKEYFQTVQLSTQEQGDKMDDLMQDMMILRRVREGYTGDPPPRFVWEDVMTKTKCPKYNSKDGPCLHWNCRGCQVLAAQVIILIICSKNISDKPLLSFFGTLFSMAPFSDWGIEDWSKVDVKLLSMLLPFMGTLNGPTIHKCFKYLVGRKLIPSKLQHLMVIPGIALKVSSLIIKSITNAPTCRIPVDLHVRRFAVALGWVQATTPEGICQEFATWATKASMGDSMWELNDLCGGIGQLFNEAVNKDEGDTKKELLYQAFQKAGESSSYFSDRADLLYNKLYAAYQDK